jgi:hypothetical protein
MTIKRVSEWSATALRELQDAIKELQGDDHTYKLESFDLAEERMEKLLADGVIHIDVSAAIRSELERADKAQGRLADNLVHILASGQGSFEMEGDPLADTIVVLGKGRRKTWAKVTDYDWGQMWETRHKNKERVNKSFAQFDADSTVVRAGMRGFKNLGEAYAAGRFRIHEEVMS